MIRTSLSKLVALAAALAGATPSPIPMTRTSGNSRSIRSRESHRSSGPYVAKNGRSAIDVARRARADAKRQRKAAVRLAQFA